MALTKLSVLEFVAMRECWQTVIRKGVGVLSVGDGREDLGNLSPLLLD